MNKQRAEMSESIMSKGQFRKFYQSKQWKELRNYIMAKYNYLCTNCGEPAKIVHHIEHLNEHNINDPNVTLNEANLTPLCQDCHNSIHLNVQPKPQYSFTPDGRLVKQDTSSKE